MSAYEERWHWWLTEVVLLADGHIDVKHARSAFESTGMDPYKAQFTPAEYVAEGLL